MAIARARRRRRSRHLRRAASRATQLKYYYSAADVFVTTPWYEPFGITPVEAMACGTPVIGARVGGIKYSVVEGRTGFLVAPRDHRGLARRLMHLYSDTAIRSYLGRQARRRAIDLFTWRTVTASIAHLYEQVLSTRSTALERRASLSLRLIPARATASAQLGPRGAA